MRIARTRHRHQQQGAATVVVIAILALLLMFSTANLINLNVLKAELDLLDEKQQRRVSPAAEHFEPGAPTHPTDPRGGDRDGSR
jgi:hypothetical protein